MEQIFSTLAEATRLSKELKGLAGRTFGLQLGIVTQRLPDDPYHRIKATVAALGAKFETDWLLHVTPAYGVSFPAPNPGDTVVILYEDGDTHKGYYLGLLLNAVNPGTSPDVLTVNVGNSALQMSKDAIALSVGGTALVISDGSVTVNGQEVTTLGAEDTRGDTLINKGWE